ncbi:MAG: putative selenium-dependent hydroxylase accessory protein YqeC [Ruminococcaceae bacterium]|nr:putative selenium-dependent hydroxylase accessory protein YqeC [Oscillospiraceae bacterium]
MKLYKLLDIKRGITSIIGGGGKTTLIHTLADELKAFGTVVIMTTTHIKKSDVFKNIITDDSTPLSHIAEELKHHRCVCIGTKADNDKLTTPHFSFSELSLVCDYILVEADGSKRLPLKAHLEYEPVIPCDSNATILVVGIDALENKAQDVTHRVDRFCEIVSCKSTDIVSDTMVASLLKFENLHDVVVINKCDTFELTQKAELLSKKIYKKCIISSLLKGEWYVSSN